MSESLRSLTKNEQIGRFFEQIDHSLTKNEQIAHFLAKNEQFAQKTDEQIPSPGESTKLVLEFFSKENVSQDFHPLVKNLFLSAL